MTSPNAAAAIPRPAMPDQRPTVLVKMADAGDLYVSWRWAHDPARRGAAAIPAAAVDAAVRALAGALPDPATPGALERSLTTGALADPAREAALAQYLSRALLPHGLAVDLHDLHTRAIRPHIRIQPSPRVAQVPWEILAPDPDLRLLDIADLSLLAPAGIVQAPGRTPRRWATDRDLPVVAILDPRVPGFRADSALGSVLGRMTTPTPLTARMTEHLRRGRLRPAVDEPSDLFRRTDLDRTWLSTTLREGASRLVYVGHVTSARPGSGQSETAELHLACTAETVGFADPQRTHRPLSAKDLLLGTHTLTADPVAGHDLWPIPSRVALIACESGGDLRFTEALGLVAAMLHGGAELVTATRWPLPTDLAVQRLAGSTGTPLQSAIRELDVAHDQDDPLAIQLAWQRGQLDAWRATGAVDRSPLLWSAFATFLT
ncbi:CHAT domain-containing protein [Nocardia farcinica]|uniref:CHAT domain-containing protein n=1 Tax=Nocardia farcinica TaxID=37329 RepID=UPI000A3AAF99|nr:CHAT domain-containing protein [Nocardia farcinica]MBF6264962.1 CHAT domain-containing protein [Nocardia farcinica]MBF6282821.1 CHAT domain-containing protein [Nocardia farcinica]MBF6307883.1 CHAT domain-containing protein [Nocardia farcinica]MBF6391050.1 CHAT domain-containing protein [Nocardia farcinica]MBF6493603.1 CHAT domain-containing protein [Nocardia farcinica]